MKWTGILSPSLHTCLNLKKKCCAWQQKGDAHRWIKREYILMICNKFWPNNWAHFQQHHWQTHKWNFVLWISFAPRESWLVTTAPALPLLMQLLFLIKKIYRTMPDELRLQNLRLVPSIALLHLPHCVYPSSMTFTIAFWHRQWKYSCIFMTAKGRHLILLCWLCYMLCWFYATIVYCCFVSFALSLRLNVSLFHFICLIHVLIALHFSRFHVYIQLFIHE